MSEEKIKKIRIIPPENDDEEGLRMTRTLIDTIVVPYLDQHPGIQEAGVSGYQLSVLFPGKKERQIESFGNNLGRYFRITNARQRALEIQKNIKVGVRFAIRSHRIIDDIHYFFKRCSVENNGSISSDCEEGGDISVKGVKPGEMEMDLIIESATQKMVEENKLVGGVPFADLPPEVQEEIRTRLAKTENTENTETCKN